MLKSDSHTFVIVVFSNELQIKVHEHREEDSSKFHLEKTSPAKLNNTRKEEKHMYADGRK